MTDDDDRAFASLEELHETAESDPARVVRVTAGEVTIGGRKARLRLSTSMEIGGEAGPVKVDDVTWLDTEARRGDA